MPAQRHLSGTPPRFDDSGSGECGRSVKKPSAAEQKSKILKEKTPIGKLEDQGGVKHPYQVSGHGHSVMCGFNSVQNNVEISLYAFCNSRRKSPFLSIRVASILRLVRSVVHEGRSLPDTVTGRERVV